MCSPWDLLGLRVPTRLSRILEQWTNGNKRLRQNCRQNLLKKRCWGPESSNETQACFEKKLEEARKRTGTDHCWPPKTIPNIWLSYCYKESHPQLAWLLRFEEFWTPQTKTNSQVKRVKIGRLDKEVIPNLWTNWEIRSEIRSDQRSTINICSYYLPSLATYQTHGRNSKSSHWIWMYKYRNE